MKTETDMAISYISQQNHTVSLILMDIDCCKEEGLGQVIPCKLSNYDLGGGGGVPLEKNQSKKKYRGNELNSQ